MSAIIPIPKFAVKIRPATMDDLPFIDGLQKKYTKQVGWFPTKTIEGKIKLGHVLIAEEPSPLPSPGVPGEGVRVGYLIGNDQYFKRDDVGIIYQINIAEGKRRGLVGAMLLKAQFERSAYGCKLYCCWCAQDIEANRFWEAMGFVPLAFRTGSAGKRRVHIFWQKRIRAGDETTPWWFPSETKGGSIREDRLVFPIPPGTHWSDAKPIILPGMEIGAPKQLEDRSARSARAPKVKIEQKTKYTIGGSKLHFSVPKAAKVKTPAPKRPKQKNDPKLVSAARELRDRWLERVNEDPSLLGANGKYEVARAIATSVIDPPPPVKMLAA